MKRSLSINLLLVAALGIGTTACKKMSASPGAASAPSSYDGAAYDYDESPSYEAADYGGDAPEMDAMAVTEAEPMERESFRTRRSEKKMSKSEMAGVQASPETSAPPEPPPKGAPKDGASKPADAEKAVEAVDDDDMEVRHIVYTAQMTVSVFNLSKALEKAEALPETYGGYVQTISESTIVLRIPSKNLRAIMGDVGDYGVVEHRALQAQDVTAEFTDIDSRIRALTETQTQLLALLSKARNVEEALHVRQALDSVNSELEVLKGRMRQLGNLITYSTLTLNLVERGPNTAPPSSNDPFPWVNDLGVEATEWK